MRKLSELLARIPVASEDDRTAEVSKGDPVSSEEFECLSRGSQRSGLETLMKHPAPLTRAQRHWYRLRALIRTICKLNRISKDIKRFGLGRNQYAETYARDELTLDKFSEVPKFLFLPTNCFLKYWTWVIFALMLYSAFILPYRVCFEEVVVVSWLVVDMTVDGLFFLDMMITFNSAVALAEGHMITNRKDIAKRYLKSWFLFDVAACLPFSLLEMFSTSLSGSKYNNLVRLLRLPRLYRVTRVLRMAKVLKNLQQHEFVRRIVSALKMNSGIIRLLHFSVAVVIGVHVAGCFWYFLAKLESFTPDTWVVQSGYADADNFTLYLVSIYFIFTCMTTVGFGDIVPGTAYEQIYTLFIMGFGIAFYSYVVSNLSTILSTIDVRSEFIKARLQALSEFSQETHLPKELFNNIKRHINHTYEHYKLSTITKDTLINELPTYLRNEVSVHLHRKIVDQVIFFQGKDPTFITYIVPRLKSESLQMGEVLYKHRDYADEMYFLIQGRVHLKTDEGLVFKTYIQGSYFGEVELVNECERECTVQVCSANAELLTLSKSNFLKMMREFPAIAKEVRKTAQIRSAKNEEAKKYAILIANTLSQQTRQNSIKHSSSSKISTTLEPEASKSVDPEEEEKNVHWAELSKPNQRPPAWRKVSSGGILKKSWKVSTSSSAVSTREQSARIFHSRSTSEPRDFSLDDEVLSPHLDATEIVLRNPVSPVVRSRTAEPPISPHILTLIGNLQQKEDALVQGLQISVSLLKSCNVSQLEASEKLTKILTVAGQKSDG